MGISHIEERRTLEDHQSGRTAKCIWRAGPANENEEAYDTGGLGGEGADNGCYPGTGRHKPHRKWEPHGAGLRAVSCAYKRFRRSNSKELIEIGYTLKDFLCDNPMLLT